VETTRRHQSWLHELETYRHTSKELFTEAVSSSVF